jgi:hypothetical protein
MPVTEEKVDITLSLPRSLVCQIQESADDAHRSLEAQARLMLEIQLRRRANLEKLIEAAQREYEEELARTGRPRPTSEQILEQLRRSREEIANELYPD